MNVNFKKLFHLEFCALRGWFTCVRCLYFINGCWSFGQNISAEKLETSRSYTKKCSLLIVHACGPIYHASRLVYPENLSLTRCELRSRLWLVSIGNNERRALNLRLENRKSTIRIVSSGRLCLSSSFNKRFWRRKMLSWRKFFRDRNVVCRWPTRETNLPLSLIRHYSFSYLFLPASVVSVLKLISHARSVVQLHSDFYRSRVALTVKWIYGLIKALINKPGSFHSANKTPHSIANKWLVKFDMPRKGLFHVSSMPSIRMFHRDKSSHHFPMRSCEVENLQTYVNSTTPNDSTMDFTMNAGVSWSPIVITSDPDADRKEAKVESQPQGNHCDVIRDVQWLIWVKMKTGKNCYLNSTRAP